MITGTTDSLSIKIAVLRNAIWVSLIWGNRNLSPLLTNRLHYDTAASHPLNQLRYNLGNNNAEALPLVNIPR
jgi:hypothetical protein